MDLRGYGLAAMAGGVVLGVVAKVVSPWELTLVLGILATVAILCGGAAVALWYREETGRTAGGSRLSLIAASAGARLSSRSGSSGTRVAAGTGSRRSATSAPAPSERELLRLYAERFSVEMSRCRSLLDRDHSAGELDDARERLMRLVANPLYGAATAGNLIDAEQVRSLSLRIARGG